MKKAIVDVPSCDIDWATKLFNQQGWVWEFTNEDYPDYDEDELDLKEPLV